MTTIGISVVAAAFAAALLVAGAAMADCMPGHNMSVQSQTPQTVVDSSTTTPPPSTPAQDAAKTGG